MSDGDSGVVTVKTRCLLKMLINDVKLFLVCSAQPKVLNFSFNGLINIHEWPGGVPQLHSEVATCPGSDSRMTSGHLKSATKIPSEYVRLVFQIIQ